MIGILRSAASVEALAFFARNLAGGMESGATLPEIIQLYVLEAQRGALARAARRMQPKLESGIPLSEAMEGEKRIFPRFMRQLARLDEASGAQAAMMRRAAETLDRSVQTMERARRAATYSLLLLGLLLVFIGLLVFKILPFYADMYTQLGAELPSSTMLLLHYSWLASRNIPLTICVFAFVFAILTMPLLGIQLNSMLVGWFVLRAPFVGEAFRRAETARFCGMLGLLLEAGMPPANALASLKEFSPNSYVRARLDSMELRYKHGEKLSRLVAAQSFFPAGLGAMLACAEGQGRLGPALKELGAHYERRAQNSIGMLAAGLPPLAMIFLGILVFFVLSALYAPFFHIVRLIR